MKLFKYIGALMLTVMAAGGFTACQDDVDAPGLQIPQATIKANTTIADLKANYWNDANNYIDTVKLNAAGEHIVIAGRVISSDASGNIYKSLVIQDATGALAMSINANSLYNDYRIGQEVVVDVTDMYIGKYSTLQQLGFPDFSAGYGWQATFMPLEFFKQHAQLNGLPEPSKVDTLTIDIAQLSNDAATLRKYQSQLVRFNNVHFEQGGEVSFCTGHKENTNRTLKDANGNEIIVRTSGYANFWSLKVPAEAGDVVGILSSFLQSGTVKWQLQLRSPSDLLNFGNPTLPKGTETNPYDVLEAVTAQKTGQSLSGWFTGYIVGTPKAGVSQITSTSDIQWSAQEEGMFIVDNVIVVGQTPEANTLDDVMVVSLPSGSDLHKYGNLFDNDSIYHRQIWLKGSTRKLMDITGISDCPGTKDDFRIEGVTVSGGSTPGAGLPDGDGTETNPYSAGWVNAQGKDFTKNSVWVSGYIVGWVDNKDQNYADEKNANFTAPATVATNVLIANSPDVKDVSKCVCVNLPNTNDIRKNVNLVDNPGNIGKLLTVNGDIIKYFAIPGVKNLKSYKLDGQGGGGDTPVTPGNPVTSLDESFSGKAKPSGWTVKNVDGSKDWFFSEYSNVTFAACTAYNGTAGSTGFESWLITPPINITAATAKTLTFKSMVGYTGQGTLEAFVMTTADPATATLTKISANIPQPTGSWGEWTESGNIDLSKYNGTIYIGWRYKASSASQYTTYRVTDVKLGNGGGGTTDPNPPVTPTGGNVADFNSLTPNSSYGTVTTTNGWVCTNVAVQQGGTNENKNPEFSCIGASDVHAVCLNGKKTSPGSVTSPVLSGGISSLTFNYGLMFGEGSSTPTLTIYIKQGDSVVATKTLAINAKEVTARTAYSVTYDFSGITGDFRIEIVNTAAGGQSGNKERVSIWNLSWKN